MVRIKIANDLLRMVLFAAASLLAVLLICEFILRPLWHILVDPLNHLYEGVR